MMFVDHHDLDCFDQFCTGCDEPYVDCVCSPESASQIDLSASGEITRRFFSVGDRTGLLPICYPPGQVGKARIAKIRDDGTLDLEWPDGSQSNHLVFELSGTERQGVAHGQ